MECQQRPSFVALGSNSIAQSIVPGAYLEFFNPAPIRQWIPNLSSCNDSSLGLTTHQAGLFCRLIYGAILRARDGLRPDTRKLVMEATKPLPSVVDIEWLRSTCANVLSKRNADLRDSIVYSSGVSDSARCLYAQEDQVFPLTAKFLEDIVCAPASKAGAHLLCAVLLQFLLIHPFPDGNGRVARHVVLRTAADRDLVATAAIIVAIQCLRRSWFNGLALTARSTGLLVYLESFEQEITRARSNLKSLKIYQCMLDRNGSDVSKKRQEELLILYELAAVEEVSLEGIRRLVSCSQGKAIALMNAVAQSYPFVEQLDRGLSIRKATNEMLAAISM